MSESGKCGCGKSTGSCGIQNGKGDAPRNISGTFRKNYEGIRWEGDDKKKRKEGTRFVKTYS
jgi:hypothetical protein